MIVLLRKLFRIVNAERESSEVSSKGKPSWLYKHSQGYYAPSKELRKLMVTEDVKTLAEWLAWEKRVLQVFGISMFVREKEGE